jgi:hypothetical protein
MINGYEEFYGWLLDDGTINGRWDTLWYINIDTED